MNTDPTHSSPQDLLHNQRETDLQKERFPVPDQMTYQTARFPTLQAAGDFARRVAKDLFGMTTPFTSAQAFGKDFIPQIWVSRELSSGTCTSIPGSILVDAENRVVGLQFTAHTEHCDSGHECYWTEDLTGKTTHLAIVPR